MFYYIVGNLDLERAGTLVDYWGSFPRKVLLSPFHELAIEV